MKIIPQIDTYPALVKFCETSGGKLTLLAAFAAALVVNRVGPWLQLTVIAAVISFLPSHRRLLLSLGTLYWTVYWVLVQHHWDGWVVLQRIAKAERQRADWGLTLLAGIVLVGIFCGAAAFLRHVRRSRRRSFVSRRPVLVLVCGYLAMVLAAGILPLGGVARVLLWTFIALLSPYLWWFAYALQDSTSKTPDGFALQFGTFRPFWMDMEGWVQPVPKGAAYLRKVEARNAKDFSIVQLKAVKLLLWIVVLNYVLKIFTVFVHGETWRPLAFLSGLTGWKPPRFGVPTLEAALQETAAGIRVPVHLAWASVVAHFCGGSTENVYRR